MGRRRALQRRPLLLAIAAVLAVGTGHVLDYLGLLPGVHESRAVRAAALAPRFTVLTVVGAALLALAAEGLLRRRRPGLAVAGLVAGQTGLLALPEALAEAAGRTGGGGEAQDLAKLAIAVGLQVAVAVLAVGIAVVVDTLLLTMPRSRSLVRIPGVPRPALPVVLLLTGRIAGGVRGRGPPVPVLP